MSELPFDDRFQAAIAERNKITNYVKSNEVKQEGQVQQQSDLFKLYEVEPGNAVYIRFFPDVDKNNTVYWRPRSTHRLTFDSIKQPDGTVVELTRPLAVDVPGWNCRANDTANNNLPPEYLLMSTDDPVQRHISSLFNDGDETSKELYRRFKAKTSYMMYGIITRYDAHREFVGKAYRFALPGQLFELIKANTTDDFYQTSPTNLEYGYDFRFQMSRKGDKNDYATNSKFAPQSSMYAVTPEMVQEFENHHFKPLVEYMMKAPTPEQAAVIEKMIVAALNNDSYDAKWAETYMPYGYHVQDGFLVSKNVETSVPETPAPVVNNVPWEAPKVSIPTPVVAPVVVPTPAPVVAPVSIDPLASLNAMAKKTVEQKVVEEPKPAPVVSAPVQEAPKPAIPSNPMDLSSVLAALGQKK